jgi:hypothetical protein
VYPIEAARPNCRPTCGGWAAGHHPERAGAESGLHSHIVTQEVVYDLMTSTQGAAASQRRLWHETPGGGRAQFPLLAHHWRLAGDTPAGDGL